MRGKCRTRSREEGKREPCFSMRRRKGKVRDEGGSRKVLLAEKKK